MPRSLAAVPLVLEEATQAYPLARALVPALELDAWLAFARRRVGESTKSGIVGVRDELGYFHGLFGYRVRHELTHDATLEIDMAIAMDLLDRAGALAVLAREIERLAARLGCGMVHVCLRPEQRRLRRWFEDTGHRIHSVVLGKSTDPLGPITG